MKPNWFCLILAMTLCATAYAQSSAMIAVGASPGGVAVNPETNTIYVTNTGDGTVSAIDGATNSVTATISVGNQPLAIAMNPATNRVYIADTQDNTVAVIDGNKNVVSCVNK
ncbi:MAG: YncE family protein [Bryobacteraceae bacterium]